MDLNGKWLISFDEENWCPDNFGKFDSKEEIMKFILDDVGDELDVDSSSTFYIGKVINTFDSIEEASKYISENTDFKGKIKLLKSSKC